MKVDDSALSSYLVDHLKPLTKANPNLLARYVAALLKNNKPKKELKTLCAEKLLDFLGDESETFVKNLFSAFEDGTISTFYDECETEVVDIACLVAVSGAAKIASTGDTTNSRNFSHPTYAGTDMLNELEEEDTDEEDDDRNHKHRRRVSRSQSLNREVQDFSFNKVNKVATNGPSVYNTNHFMVENFKIVNVNHTRSDDQSKRLLPVQNHGYGGHSRLSVDESQWEAFRRASSFRADGRFERPSSLSRGVLGQGRGALTEPWIDCEHKAVSDAFNLPLVPLGPTSFIPYSGRSSLSRGVALQSSWAGFGQYLGGNNSSLDQASPLDAVMQGTKGFMTNPSLFPAVGRLRCSDFEERGYCMRGDLCPMEHGANRIVVEDVQSLSHFNLPLALPSGRNATITSMAVSTSPYLNTPTSKGSNAPLVNGTNISKGYSPNNASHELDVYDPDQPFLNREQPTGLGAGLKRVSSFRKDVEDDEVYAGVLKRHKGQSQNEGKSERFSVNVSPHSSTPGPPVFNDINHSFLSDSNAESSIGPRSSCLIQLKAQSRVFMEDDEPQILPGVRENHSNEKEERVVKSSSSRAGVSNFVPEEAGLHFSEKINNHTSSGRQNMDLGTERAQRTLYVSYLPSSNNRRNLLKAHFQKFGVVVDIRVPSQGDRAFVQFSDREGAEAALKSPEAVMGNRFIRLSWAKRDNRPISSANDPVKPAFSVNPKQQAVTVSAASEPSLCKTTGKVLISSVPPMPSTAVPRKQEELELMKEELRRKQDELAQKRDDFRRKLERLSKQGSGVTAKVFKNHASDLTNRVVKVDVSGHQPANKQLSLEKLEAGLESSRKEISALSASIEKALLRSDQSTSAVLTDPVKVSLGLSQASTGSLTPLSHRGSRGHSPWPGGTGLSSQWSFGRYKLDNRTTTFRVLPPFPDGLPDVTLLKHHFSLFGDVSNVEVEDVDESVQNFKVTFHTRNAAEQAFLQGRSFQGTSLCFSWAKPSSGINTGASSFGNVQVDSTNDYSSQTLFEAPAERRSGEAELHKKGGTWGGSGSLLDDLVTTIKGVDSVAEPSGYNQVAETNPANSSAGAAVRLVTTTK